MIIKPKTAQKFQDQPQKEKQPELVKKPLVSSILLEKKESEPERVIFDKIDI